MKNLRNASALWLLALGLSVAFQACKPKEPEVLDPDVSGIEKITLPPVTATQPQPITSTVGTIAPSAAATASVTALASGNITPDVERAEQNTVAALGSTEPTAITSAFTASVATNFAATGTLPSALQTQMTSLITSPSFASYLPVIVRPTVNGTAVGSVRPVVNEETIFDAPQSFAVAATAADPCIEKALEARNNALETLRTARDQQISTFTTTFTTRQTTITANAASCLASVNQATSSRNTDAIAALNAALTGIASAQSAGRITAQRAVNLQVFALAAYTAAINGSRTLDAAERARCEQVRAAEIAEAARVRNVDIEAVRAAFTTASATVTAEFTKIETQCHNQGSGN